MKKSLSLALFVLLSSQANAHDRWILPSHFNVSSDKGSVWVTSDTSASNQVFEYDKPFSADAVIIQTPNGKTDKPASIYKGKRKSVFDYQLTDDGTYKFEYPVKAGSFTRYKVKGEEGVKRKRADKATTKADAPAGAYDFYTKQFVSRVETYVTLNSATRETLAPSGQYLELTPITHPADIVQNEQAVLKFTYDGQPVENLEVEIVADGTMYRNQPNKVSLKSDAQGMVHFTPAEAGRYLLHAEHSIKFTDNKDVDELGSSIFLTFAVGLE